MVIGDFFTEGHLDKLPSTEPTATIREAVGHISRSLGVQVGREAEGLTVHSVVTSLLKYKTECFGWNHKCGWKYLPRMFASKLVAVCPSDTDVDGTKRGEGATRAEESTARQGTGSKQDDSNNSDNNINNGNGSRSNDKNADDGGGDREVEDLAGMW